MRLTRKLYSESNKEDDDNEKAWERRRNVGIVGTAAGIGTRLLARPTLSGKSGHSKRVLEALDRAKRGVATEADAKLINAGQGAKTMKTAGAILAGAGGLLAVGSELKRRSKKKKNENKA